VSDANTPHENTADEPVRDEPFAADEVPAVDDVAAADAATEVDAGAAAQTPREAGATAEGDAETDVAASSVADAAPPHYGIGPFSVREVALLGVWLVAFIVSFFSVYAESRFGEALGLGASVWTSGIDWILTIGVPTAAVFLIALRRFSPDGIRRVGSLGIDQFASVAFSVSTVVWLGILWNNIARAASGGFWLNSWVVWVEFFLMLVGVFLTTLAPFIAPFDADFRHRPEQVAHSAARRARPVVARPAVERTAQPPAATAPAAYGTTSAGYGAAADPSPFAPHAESQTESHTEVLSQADVQVQPAAATQAFWALAPVERDVVDENGIPLFTVGPTAWALVIEDRGDAFVVRHEDGRIGYLTDVSGVTRG